MKVCVFLGLTVVSLCGSGGLTASAAGDIHRNCLEEYGGWKKPHGSTEQTLGEGQVNPERSTITVADQDQAPKDDKYTPGGPGKQREVPPVPSNV